MELWSRLGTAGRPNNNFKSNAGPGRTGSSFPTREVQLHNPLKHWDTTLVNVYRLDNVRVRKVERESVEHSVNADSNSSLKLSLNDCGAYGGGRLSFVPDWYFKVPNSAHGGRRNMSFKSGNQNSSAQDGDSESTDDPSLAMLNKRMKVQLRELGTNEWKISVQKTIETPPTNLDDNSGSQSQSQSHWSPARQRLWELENYSNGVWFRKFRVSLVKSMWALLHCPGWRVHERWSEAEKRQIYPWRVGCETDEFKWEEEGDEMI